MNFLSYCDDLEPIIRIAKAVVNLIKWGIPIILIIFGMLDLGKAVMAGKEDEMKKAQSTLIKRLIYAVAIFLVVTIVMFVMDIVAGSGADKNASTDAAGSWYDCWSTTKSAR